MVRVLVLNAGSSSLKASLVEQAGDRLIAAGERKWGSDASRASGRANDIAVLIGDVAVDAGAVEAVGYRVVHGGAHFVAPTLMDGAVLRGIRELDALAPLHNAVAADVIDAATGLLPDRPHVACFDTAFHATLPEASWRYPVPDDWRRERGIRRFGFHGLSVSWSVERAALLLDRSATELQVVVAHLGSGCSATAIAGGRSVATTMGMTPLEGMMMGTRSGSIDPGVMLYLLRDGRLSVDELADAITHRSGLLGMAGSTDAQALEEVATRGDAQARLALDMFADSASGWIAAMATYLDRLDALVFTGGIGEHSHPMRERICRRLGVLGIPSPEQSKDEKDAVLSAGDSPVVLRVKAREDLVISRAVAAVLG